MERLKDDENYDIAKEEYYPLIKIILNDFDVTPANFQKKLKIIVKQIKICLT